ncbi:MAG: preprotein translocase subunit SecY [Clostridia bacterium]|nr:preprotein translocase subunit SecY [Loktanella sp.]MBQ1950544.1 preprotein translocase subunit SecY [Clostridia bacterium]
MFQTLRNAWRIEDLRKKILFTAFILLIFRIGSAVTVPFVDVEAMKAAVAGNTNDFLNNMMLLSGGGFSNASVFALSITPYINASIIIQLLTVAIPALERLAKEGEAGRKRLGQITRYTTVILGLMLGIAYYFMVRNQYGALVSEAQSGFAAWFAAIVIVLCFTAGSALMMWLGDQINEKGIGNGISMLLFAGILSRIPVGANYLWQYFYQMGVKQIQAGESAGIGYVLLTLLVLVLFLAMIAFIVFMGDAERRIPVQYAKKVVGRKMYGGQNTYIPIKVNMSGVMPIILAVSILSLPSIIAGFMSAEKVNNWFFNAFKQDSWTYIVLYFLMIIGFSYFYVTIQYNAVEMSNNLRKNGGAIPGQRPGKPTADFIKRVLNKVTFIGALFLGVIALFPSLFGKISGITGLTIGGTSIMIVVGVALETVQQMESQMMMRHYKGFLD